MSQTQPTVSEFQRWARDVAPAARACLMARVHAELTRERVAAYVRPIFESFGFTYGAICRGEWSGRIPDPEHLYLADDGPMMTAYYAECDQAHRAHGFTGPAGHCPALTAESLQRETENALIGLARPLFGLDACDLYGETRAQYLKLLIGACLKAEREGVPA